MVRHYVIVEDCDCDSWGGVSIGCDKSLSMRSSMWCSNAVQSAQVHNYLLSISNEEEDASEVHPSVWKSAFMWESHV
jgi:hypothetical protein